MKPRILIIDDDHELNRLTANYLEQFDFDVTSVGDPNEGFQLIQTEEFSLIVLDIMLPAKTGFQLCSEIRRMSSIPIIMVTARGDFSDRVVGLELGADDYMPKPYEPRELVARIQSVLRRSRGAAFPSKRVVLCSGGLAVDLDRVVVSLNNSPLDLTTAEFGVLRLLIENRGRTLSRDEIYQQLRGSNWDSVDRSVDMVVSRLRQKLKDDTKNSHFLKTMWGEGYRFVGEVVSA